MRQKAEALPSDARIASCLPIFMVAVRKQLWGYVEGE